jgi:LysM repeat protein
MRRLILLPALATVFVATVACGSSDDGAIETLPPIRTTSTIATTSTTVDLRRRFYEVKPGDNLSEIARRFEVPRSEIVKMNRLADNGNLLQVGQILEIPTDIVLIEELPTPETTEEP